MLAGTTEPYVSSTHVMVHHTCTLSGNDLLRKFWEMEDGSTSEPILFLEEKAVVQHFQSQHYRLDSERCVVPLSRCCNFETPW